MAYNTVTTHLHGSPALADLNPDVELMPGYHRSSIVKQLLRGRENALKPAEAEN